MCSINWLSQNQPTLQIVYSPELYTLYQNLQVLYMNQYLTNCYKINLYHEDYEKLMNFSRKIAIALKKSVNCKRIGLSVVGLEVPHVHVHLIPLDSMSDMNFSRSVKLNDSEFKSIVKKIKSNLK